MNRKETAAQLFAEGFNCAQSVFAVFAEKYGITKETALKTACGFGGGMRNGEVCGAVTGAIMIIGLRYGHTAGDDNDSRTLCYQKNTRIYRGFPSEEQQYCMPRHSRL